MQFTKEELAWVKRVQKALDSCPSTRIAFATTGDNDLTLFDKTRYDDICEAQENSGSEFIPTAETIGAVFPVRLNFPNQVESTAG